jgi:CxxC motif-containing protein (DUF1111 family)
MQARLCLLALVASCAWSGGGGGGVAPECADGFVRCAGLCLEAAACEMPVCTTPVGDAPGELGPRGFRQRLDFDGATATVTVETGAGSGPLTGTTAIDLQWHTDGELHTVPFTGDGTTWVATFAGAPGDVVDYYLAQRFAPTTIHPAAPGTSPTVDSAWFRRTLGAPPPPPVAYPLRVDVAARFRDRHRNEWRYDHYVAGYDDGAAFALTIVDHGDALDVTIVPDPAAQVGKVDLKWFDVFGPTPFCGDPPALAGLSIPDPGLTRSGDAFTGTITGVTEGQLVDFELTLTNLPGAVTTYYTEWFHYRVGTGELGRKHQDPRAYAAGDAAVSDVSVHQFAYAQHVLDARPETLDAFLAGKLVFDSDAATGMLVNPPTTFDCRGTIPLAQPPTPSPLASALEPARGPDHDAASCAGCHRLDGRGDDASRIVKLDPPHPRFGDQLSRTEASVTVVWEDVPGAFADGTAYTLRRPRYTFSASLDGSAPSVRLAPAVFGLGLVEAVPTATLAGLADPDDADGDGISGALGAGRFGWKASQPTLEAQAAAAFAGDLGIEDAELDDRYLDDVAAYLRALSPPPRDNHRDPAAERGKALFDAAGCGGCHTPYLVTALEPRLPELARQMIQPFSDFLLHDLGDDLADAGEDGAEWRTAPLWGLAFADHALGEAMDPDDPNRPTGVARYLHDGRARTPMEAILWHGGEAAASRELVLAMSADERADLLAYVRYPFTDPPRVACP